MKARNVLWPVVIMSALSLAGACGSDDGGGGGGDPVGGNDGSGDEGGSSNTGATSSSGGGTQQTGGMSTSDAGEASSGGTSPDAAAGMTGVGGGAVDLCADLDLDCEDDDNPCTEDECNPATGECGIPRTGSSCDDGVYCNGDDTCEAGECTEHDGNPCGAQDCNEADDACECETKDDCPADVAGNWSECVYGDGDTCVETGQRTRAETVYACTEGKCVASPNVGIDTAGCDRETDTLDCLDDANPCTGVEKCKNGACTSSGINPCAGEAATPYCYASGTMCRECTTSFKTGSPNLGCDDGQYCCSGVCKTSSCGLVAIGSISVISASPTKIE